MPEQPCCWGRGWCKTQNAHEARPRPSFRGQKAVSHVVWTQIPSTVLPPGQMTKCENCDSVHWQPQQSSVQVCEPETGVEKVKRKWLQRTGPEVYCGGRLSAATFSSTFQLPKTGFLNFQPLLQKVRRCTQKTDSLSDRHRRQNQSAAIRVDKDRCQNTLESLDANTHLHNMKTLKPSFANTRGPVCEAIFSSLFQPQFRAANLDGRLLRLPVDISQFSHLASSLHVRMYAQVLAPCSNWRPFVQEHIFYRQTIKKCGPLHRDDFNRSHFATVIAERNAARCPSKSA